MSESTFDLFGPASKNDIKVGYISTDRGYVQGVDVCAANLHAKNNPGQTFIYKPDRSTVQFLNINEVNKLAANPSNAEKDTSCPEGLDMNAVPKPPRVIFLGGGGLGAAANPVIANDGRLMAIDLVNKGYGYKFPPIVQLLDDSGLGAGSVINVGVGTVGEETIYYADEDEFEEYNICENLYGDEPYGARWSPSGENIGSWNPQSYTADYKRPFQEVVDEYIKLLNSSGKDWWTTRKEAPLKITSNVGTTQNFYKVQHWSWGPGTQTALTEVPFEIHWHSPHRTKALGFEFVARDGSHSFRIVDTSKENDGHRNVVYQVKENTTYDVKVIGKRPGPQMKTKDSDKIIHLAELGLLKKLGKGSLQKDWKQLDANKTGTGDKIFADFLDTVDDADDIQVQAQKGKFTASNARRVQGLRQKRKTYDLTYRLETGKTVLAPSFMNNYAISPKPASNARGSDFAGRWFTFEWEIDFPHDGEYIFRTARDNRARIYLDNQSYTDQLKTYTGTNPRSGKVGPKGGYGNKITLKKGLKRLRLDLYNEPVLGEVPLQQAPAPSNSEVTFKIVGSSWFTDGVRIEGLDINEIKDFTFSDVKGQLNTSHTRKVEFGRKYKVVFTSKESSNIQLRTKDPNVIQMENAGDGSYDDVVIHASSGQFTDLKGNIAYFSVPKPSRNAGQSGGSQGSKTKEVFNTIDYINKANRKLWRTNVYNRGGFLNDYGICPFDTKILLKDNPYAGTHRIVWPNVKFPIDGNYDIEVEVDDNVNISIGKDVKIERKGFVGDSSVSNGKLTLTRYIKSGTHTITADLEQKVGGSYGFRQPDGREIQKTDVTFKVTSESQYANKITIPGLFEAGKQYKGVQLNKTVARQVENEKEYDVILSSEQSKDTRIRIKNNGKRLEMEDWRDGDWQDLVCTVTHGEFYQTVGNRCKYRVDRTLKGLNPMALAINIETTFDTKTSIMDKSWNENPMGVAMTIEAPAPPIPQEPIPKSEGRCPDNPYWTTRFPGAKEKWYPVRYDGWGKLLNAHGISPLPPYDKDRQPLVDVDFEVVWHSPHRNKGLGYKFTSDDGSHTFTIVDASKVSDGSRNEKHKVKLNTTYNVKTIGKRAAPQGNKIDPQRKSDNSKVIELAEQGLLKQLGATRGGKDNDKFKKGSSGTGDIIFADFLDTLDDADDLQIQAGAGLFTALNPRTVQSLKGTRTSYDLTYRIDQLPPNEGGSFENSWTKTFDFGGYYKAKLEADDIAELWIDDVKVLATDRRKRKTFDEKLIYIDGPTKDGDESINHDIKVVVENFSSAKTKSVNAKVFSTMDWIGGGALKAEEKAIRFKITSNSMFANSIKIPELGINESKSFTPGQRGQINVTREKEVEVNKVYDVEFFSSSKAPQTDWGIKYTGLHSANNPITVRRNNKRIELKDGHGNDANASFTIDSGNVKFSDDGKNLIIKGKEAKITLDWNDNPNTAGVAIDSIQIGDKVWRREGRSGSKTQMLTFARNTDNTSNIRLRNKGESVVQMEDWTDTSYDDFVCAASEGRFFDFTGNKCKYMVSAATKVAGGITGGTTRQGVTYQGPHLFHHTDSRWSNLFNRESISPIGTPTQSLSEPNDNILGKKILTWKNVNFPQTAKYQVSFKADDGAQLFIDDQLVVDAKLPYTATSGSNELQNVDIEAGKGTHDIKIVLTNTPTHSNIFLDNPTGVMLRIYTKMIVGTGTYKSWKENPMGVSAKLIPPPCPRKIKGKGIVVDPKVIVPGSYPPIGPPGDYPVRLKMKEPIVVDPGINYNCAEDKIRLEPSNGVKLSMCQCGPFGRVEKVCIEGDGYFTEPPDIIIDSPTGINLDLALQFEVERVPPDITDIIQVTDLVGIKKTGYYKGKPYYGAVFYENGVKYSGWYKTAGEMVRVYDTLQESIDGMVTTPPSAILRQGSDVSSNDPRLNIPGTPENLI